MLQNIHLKQDRAVMTPEKIVLERIEETDR